MIILPHEARFCTIFGKIFKENEKSQPLWLTLNDLYFALNMDFQRKKPIFAYKTSYFQFGTLKYIDVFKNMQEEAIIAGNAIQIYRDLKNSIIEIAQARAAESLIEENEKNLLLIKKQSGAYDEYVKALKNVRITQSEYNKATAKGKGKISDIGIYGSYAQYDNDSLERYNAAKLRLGEALAAIRDSLDKAGDDGRAVWNRIQDEFDGDVIRFVESLEAGNKRLSKEAEKLYTTLTPEEQNKKTSIYFNVPN